MPHIWKDKEHTQLSYRPDNKFGIIWGQELGDPTCPYLKRWVLQLKIISIRLHHWRGSDDPRHMHDHAWGFWTFVLKGGYTDVTECDICRATGWITQFYPLGINSNALSATINCYYCQGSGKVGEHLNRFSFKYRDAHHIHTVQTDPGGAWTLLLTGPKVRDWGWWVDGQWMKVRKYFREFGHHPCDD